MNKIDKKQLPQLIALIVLSVGVFGFFIFRMIVPTPAAAQAPKTAKSSETEAAKKVAVAITDAGEIAPAPAPSALMRDPFLPGVADTAALEAYQKARTVATPTPSSAPRRFTNRRMGTASLTALSPMPVPQVSPLPNMGALPGPGQISAAPTVIPAPAAPVTWTVTGVMGGDGGVAILRDGDKRRIVRQGDQLEGGLRIHHIARGAVILERDGQTYRLPLGGAKDAAPRTPAADSAPAANAPAAPIIPTQEPIAP
ncbi:MAG: hypothetical protein JWQ02_802 [Capsulimonas sp.]|nr:hypothetical protein [Capsulimonas sp.]